MPWGIYEVQYVLFTLHLVFHTYWLHLYGNSSLSFKIHPVEYLCLHFTCLNSVCYLKHAVSQGTLPVIYMRYDAEVSNIFHTYSVEP